MVTFRWLNVNGGKHERVSPFHEKFLEGGWSRLGKTMVKTGLKIKQFDAHQPIIEDVQKWYLGDGEPYIYQRGDMIGNKIPKGICSNYFIIHDLMRSPVSYIASLSKGYALLPNSQKTKPNRWGYNFLRQLQKVKIHNCLPDVYFRIFDILKQKLMVDQMGKKSMETHILHAIETLRLSKLPQYSSIKDLIRKDFPDLDKLFLDLITMLDPKIVPKDITYENMYKLPEEYFYSDQEFTADKIYRILSFYPFATDEGGDHVFLQYIIKHLLDMGRFTDAQSILANKSLIVNNYYSNIWSLPLFANAYEKFGMKDEALKCYERMNFCRTLDVRQKINNLNESR